MKTWAISSGFVVSAALVVAQPLEKSLRMGGPQGEIGNRFQSAIVVAQSGPSVFRAREEKSPRHQLNVSPKFESSQLEERTTPSPTALPSALERGRESEKSAAHPVVGPPKGKLTSIANRLGVKSGFKGAKVDELKSSESEPSEKDAATSLEGEETAVVPAGGPHAFIRPVTASPGTGMVQEGTYSVLEDKLARYRPVTAPAPEPTDVCGAVRVATGRLVAHYSQGNYQALAEETEQIRAHVCSLRNLRTLSLEQRLKVSSICRMLDDGLQLIEEGQKAGDPARIQLGLEKLHEASELLQPVGAE